MGKKLFEVHLEANKLPAFGIFEINLLRLPAEYQYTWDDQKVMELAL